jgi:probable phosphoglycerate mutase
VKRLVLIRHGEAQAHVDQVVIGHDCTGLSDHGRAQAARLRDRLLASGELRGTTVFYASLMRRSQETAEIIAAGVGDGSLEIRHDCGVCEHHPGEGEGLSFEEWEANHGGWDRLADRTRPWAPGAESTDELVGRIADALERLAGQHAGETVVVACHGGVIGASFEALAGIPFGSLVNYTENTAMTEWVRNGDAWALVRYNDAAHLAGL